MFEGSLGLNGFDRLRCVSVRRPVLAVNVFEDFALFGCWKAGGGV